MTGPRATYEPHGSGGDLDPLQALATSLFEGLATGISAVNDLLTQASGTGTGHGGGQSEGSRKGDELASLVIQAYLVAAASGFRYWRRVLEAYGAHQSSILSSILTRITKQDLSEEERLGLAEDIRTYLREVADTSLQEARLLQSELEKLGEGFATAAGDVESDPPYQRRWKAKP